MEKNNQKGMFLERILTHTHHYYRVRQAATIYKVPVGRNWDYANNLGQRAHYFCDYVGCYQGYYLEFEAKVTSRLDFHWSQLRKSQHYKLHQVAGHRGLSFVILYFEVYNQFWLLFYEDLRRFVASHTQKVSYETCQRLGSEIKMEANLVLDYLPILIKKIVSQETLFSGLSKIASSTQP